VALDRHISSNNIPEQFQLADFLTISCLYPAILVGDGDEETCVGELPSSKYRTYGMSETLFPVLSRPTKIASLSTVILRRVNS